MIFHSEFMIAILISLFLFYESSNNVQYPSQRFNNHNNNNNNNVKNHMEQQSTLNINEHERIDSNPESSYQMHNVTVLMLISNQKELPVHYETLKPTMELALDEIRTKYPHINFNLITRRDHHDCESNLMGAIVAEHYFNDRIDALIGPICTKGLEQVARLASYWNLPLMTAGGVGVQFSDKTIYKTLTRVSFALGEQFINLLIINNESGFFICHQISDRVALFFIKILQDHDWHHISMIVDESDSQSLLIKTSIETKFNDITDYEIFLDKQILSDKIHHDETLYDRYLLQAKKSARGN